MARNDSTFTQFTAEELGAFTKRELRVVIHLMQRAALAEPLNDVQVTAAEALHEVAEARLKFTSAEREQVIVVTNDETRVDLDLIAAADIVINIDAFHEGVAKLIKARRGGRVVAQWFRR